MKRIDELLILPASLHDAGRYDEALDHYRAIRSLAEHSPLYWNNLGNTLLELNRHYEAFQSYRRAVKILPQLIDTRVAMATCLQMLGHRDLAMSVCNSVLRQDSGNAEAHWNRALLLLQAGDYRHGWQEYEWRWRRTRFTSPKRNFSQPAWTGGPLAGRRLLVHAEQGLGDTIQFARYLPLLREQGASLLFECHPPLTELLQSVDPQIPVTAFGETDVSCFDLHAPLLSLPHLLGAGGEIPSRTPYLAAPPARHQFWERVLDLKRKTFKVGLCWQGKSYPDPLRSCPADALTPLAGIAGVEYFSLQADQTIVRPDLAIHDLSMALLDFSDTAAVISRLDLVITIDTSVAHLAGALGKPAWVMLPKAPDWRWGISGDTTVWYPGMRLFRMEKKSNWHEMIRRVAGTLQEYCATTRS